MLWLSRLELPILSFIQNHFRCRFLDVIMSAVTLLGEHGIFCIVLTLVLISFKKTRKAGFSMAAAILLGYLIGNLMLKNIFVRLRPYEISDTVNIIVAPLSDFSFPSGHCLVTFEAACVLMCYYRKPFGIVALCLAVAVAFSRLYLYVHFPSDVVVGCLLGTLLGLLGCYIVKKLYKLKK